MNRDRYESLEYDGRLYNEMRRIEREKEDLQRKLKEKDKEIERLNNIINELEKSILKKLEAYKTDKNYFIDEKTMEDLYEELKELKNNRR